VDTPLLHIGQVADFSLKGFTFDGENQVDDLLTVTGLCPGLRLENLELRNFRRRAVTLFNCSGRGDAPITLSQTRIVGDWKVKRTALAIQSRPVAGYLPTNRQIVIQDCRFEGLFDVVVLLDGSVLDLTLVRNRIFASRDPNAAWVTDAVLYKKADPPYALRMTIESNTVSRLANGVRLEALPPVDGTNQVSLRNNLIVGANAFVAVDEPVRDPGRAKQLFPGFACNVTRPGYSKKQPSWLPLTTVEFPYMDVNQTDDKRFLRYNKESPLFRAGVDGGPVGVPP
jgi:hypothetical protein